MKVGRHRNFRMPGLGDATQQFRRLSQDVALNLKERSLVVFGVALPLDAKLAKHRKIKVCR